MRDWKQIKQTLSHLWYLLRGERLPGYWWAKVHGLNREGAKITLTLYRPMAIDQVAGYPGMEHFTSVLEFEYRKPEDRDPVFDRFEEDIKRYGRRDRYKGAASLSPYVKPNEVCILDHLKIDPSNAPESLLEEVKKPKYGWDDVDMGHIFKKIDMMRLADQKKKKVRT